MPSLTGTVGAVIHDLLSDGLELKLKPGDNGGNITILVASVELKGLWMTTLRQGGRVRIPNAEVVVSKDGGYTTLSYVIKGDRKEYLLQFSEDQLRQLIALIRALRF